MDTITVLLDRAGVIALAKPAGLATQAPDGVLSVESWLHRRQAGPWPGGYVGVPHRLDRAVSGVILLATTPRAARKLSRQFERRQIRKSYLALVAPANAGSRREVARCGGGGEPAVWQDSLEKIPGEPRARIAGPATGAGRNAVTLARLVADHAESGRLLLELEPLTGRMHQIRLQAASRGLPIVGDEVYGGPPLADVAASDPRERPILLHARRIMYLDPESGEQVTVEAPLPAYWPPWARGGCDR